MAESENYRKGVEMRRKLMGDAAVGQMAQGTYSDPVMQKFLDVAIENVFGAHGPARVSTSRPAR